MSDDDIPDKVKAQLEADAFVFGTGFAEKTDDGEYKRIDPADVSISIDGDTTLKRAGGDRVNGHEDISFSFDITFDVEDVKCPRCGVENHLPSGHLLTLLSDGPIHCSMCHYPLL